MVPVYITILQSYAGKYIPGLAYKIHQANPSAKLKINLKGVAIGDGLCDPVNVCYYVVVLTLHLSVCTYANVHIHGTHKMHYGGVGMHTIYGKTFEWENFHGFHDFSLNCKYIPVNYLNI